MGLEKLYVPCTFLGCSIEEIHHGKIANMKFQERLMHAELTYTWAEAVTKSLPSRSETPNQHKVMNPEVRPASVFRREPALAQFGATLWANSHGVIPSGIANSPLRQIQQTMAR